MPRGRTPQPTTLKLLRGNPGKRRLPAHEPQPAPELPAPPDHLSAGARAEWARVAPELHRLGVLTMADRSTMAAYCQVYAQWVEAEAAIAREGLTMMSTKGTLMAHPAVRISHQALTLLRQYMTELGLTPASRARLATGNKPPADPLEAFLQIKKKART